MDAIPKISAKKHEQIYFDLKMNHCTFYITVKSLAMVKKIAEYFYEILCKKKILCFVLSAAAAVLLLHIANSKKGR